MLDLILLTSVVTSSGGEGTSPVVTPTYTNIEIYFWYATLLIMVILTIIFVKRDVKGKKKIVNISNLISKRINVMDKYILEGKNDKDKYRKMILGTIHVLESMDVTLIEVKEQTRLDDLTKIMLYKNEVVNELKTVISLPMGHNIEELKKVNDKLLTLKGKIDLVATLIK